MSDKPLDPLQVVPAAGPFAARFAAEAAAWDQYRQLSPADLKALRDYARLRREDALKNVEACESMLDKGYTNDRPGHVFETSRVKDERFYYLKEYISCGIRENGLNKLLNYILSPDFEAGREIPAYGKLKPGTRAEIDRSASTGARRLLLSRGTPWTWERYELFRQFTAGGVSWVDAHETYVRECDRVGVSANERLTRATFERGLNQAGNAHPEWPMPREPA